MNKDLQLMKAAMDAEVVKVEFEIELGNKKFPVHFTSGDRFEMAEIQDNMLTEYLISYREKGWDEQPIEESKFKKLIEMAKDKKARERLIEQKPANLAEQKAQSFAIIRTVRELIPKYLKKPNDELLCPTEEDRKLFSQMIAENIKLFNLLMGKYFEMVNRENEIEEAVKNSSKQEAQNG